MDLKRQHSILCSKLRGHFQYFGRELQHAGDGSGPPPCPAWMEVLAKSPQQQEGAELGEIRRIAGEHAVADTQDHPRCLNAYGVVKVMRQSCVVALITKEPNDRIGHVRICAQDGQ